MDKPGREAGADGPDTKRRTGPGAASRRDMPPYLVFVRDNARFLGFGFLLSFGSSFGQTYFVAMFGADIRADFALSHGDFGAIYSVATILSGLCLVWLGKRIDDYDLRAYSAFVVIGLASACLLLAFAPAAGLLYVAFFGLRLFGQGMMSHTSATSMARYFDTGRGKAMSIASLGMSVGEGFFPLIAVAMSAALGWRGSWIAYGAVLAVAFLPFMLWLLKGHGERHRRMVAGLGGEAADRSGRTPRQWSRAEVLRDPRFYLLVPAVIAPAGLLTGLFFHQAHLAASKGWSLAWLASCFVGFAAAKIGTSLAIGPLVDRFGAMRLLPGLLPPMAAGLLLIALTDEPAAAMAYMILSGVTVGASVTMVGAMWAEIYGVAHVGAIRALITAIMMFATALTPVGMGWLIDRGVSMEAIAWLCLAYTAGAMLLLAFVSRREAGRSR